jgi:hypothetical protein
VATKCWVRKLSSGQKNLYRILAGKHFAWRTLLRTRNKWEDITKEAEVECKRYFELMLSGAYINSALNGWYSCVCWQTWKTTRHRVCSTWKFLRSWDISVISPRRFTLKSLYRRYIWVAFCWNTNFFSKRSFDRLWQNVGSYGLVLLKSRWNSSWNEGPRGSP